MRASIIELKANIEQQSSFTLITLVILFLAISALHLIFGLWDAVIFVFLSPDSVPADLVMFVVLLGGCGCFLGLLKRPNLNFAYIPADSLHPTTS